LKPPQTKKYFIILSGIRALVNGTHKTHGIKYDCKRLQFPFSQSPVEFPNRLAASALLHQFVWFV
jgi:hypothetical protein